VAVSITTNHAPRDIILGYELTDKEREEFDYIDFTEDSCHEFFRYRKELYDLSEFFLIPDSLLELQGWDAYQSDSYFSGLVVRYVEDYERVIVGLYTS
jgi:hypothetical protein